MTISLKHAFTSAKGDPGDTTLVRPSNWNAEHTLTLATDKLLGRSTAGTGAAEEIPCTSAGRSVLAAADIAAIQALLGITDAFTTGDVKFTLKTTADSGWVMMNDGSIGNASSSATTRADADTESLFTLLWDNVSNTYAAVSGGRGGSAAADFAANKRINLTKTLGRALAAAGAGSGLSNRALGETLGEEEHLLDWTEMPDHNHSGTTGDQSADHTHQYDRGGTSGLSASAGGGTPLSTNVNTTSSGASGGHTHDFTTDGAGDDAPHNNMQPTAFLNVMVKL